MQPIADFLQVYEHFERETQRVYWYLSTLMYFIYGNLNRRY
jgi:hypothetical protein